MEEKKTSPAYKVIRFLVWLFSPKMKIEGLENMPEEPAILVGNHAQMYGPIGCEIHLPFPRYIWCAWQMMRWKEVHAYAYQDFWSRKPRSIRWFYRVLSYLITPLAVCIFNNAHTIPVYHDARVLTTFRTTLRALEGGSSVVIFPEHDVEYNHILYDFQDRFIDVAKMYYRASGKALAFVPTYVCPALKKIVLGTPVRFRPEAPIAKERQRICDRMKERITAMAEALPVHTVVPYRKISKKDYPINRPQGDAPS